MDSRLSSPAPRRILQCGLTAASMLLLAGLAGCVVAPVQPGYVGYGGYASDVVMVAPPPAQVELMGVAPIPGQVWINGYWNWVGGRHAWVGGHWEAGRPGYRWEPHRWVRRDATTAGACAKVTGRAAEAALGTPSWTTLST